MLLKNLTKVYVSNYSDINDHGEITKSWQFKGICFLNLQQDVNELDRRSSGEVDYSIYKGRSDKYQNIVKGDGISFEDIRDKSDFIPDYRVMDINNIGNTFVYRMEKLQ